MKTKYVISYYPEDRLDGTDVIETTSSISTTNKESTIDIIKRVLELEYVKWIKIEIIK